MRIAIESTPSVTEIDGVQCRIWHGVTASGTRCTVLVQRLVVAEGEDQDRCRHELRELEPPRFFTPLILILPREAP